MSEFEVDRRALMAAQLLGDDMINGYADGKFGFPYDPPMSLDGAPSRYNRYARGYERAIQQNAMGVDDEFAARHGITYTVYLQTTARRNGLQWGAKHNFMRRLHTGDCLFCGKSEFNHGIPPEFPEFHPKEVKFTNNSEFEHAD